MSLGPTVALVAAGLAVVGGTSYVSLMGGGPDSRAPAAQQVTGPRSSASTNGLSTYFDETFASVRTSTRSAAEIRTASIARGSTFAERFDGVVNIATAANAATRSIVDPEVRTAAAKPMPAAAPKVRAVALRMEERA